MELFTIKKDFSEGGRHVNGSSDRELFPDFLELYWIMEKSGNTSERFASPEPFTFWPADALIYIVQFQIPIQIRLQLI